MFECQSYQTLNFSFFFRTQRKMSTHSKTDDEEKMTPTKELGRILDSFVEGSQKRSKCVLLATGSFNPIHKGHLYQFEMAKEFLGKVHK